jgi:hypothetical protein
MVDFVNTINLAGLIVIKHFRSAHHEYASCRDRALGIATGYGLDDRGAGVRVPVRSRMFSSPSRRDRLWGSPNLLSNR